MDLDNHRIFAQSFRPSVYGDEAREYRRLLYGVLAVVLLVLLLNMAGQWMLGALGSQRLVLQAVGAVVVGVSYLAVRRSIRLGTAILVIGLWLISTLSVALFTGVHSAGVMIFAFLIVLTGWVLGPSWLIVMSAASVAVIVLFGALEYAGLFVPRPRNAVSVVGSTVIGSLLAISFLTLVAYRSLGLRRDRALALSEDLGRQNLEIAQRERDLQLIMQHIPVGLTSIDAEMRFRIVNARYAAMFEKTPEELVGQKLVDRVPREQLELLLPRWQACLQGEAQHYRRQHRDPLSGEERTIDVELVPEITDGRVTGMFGLVQDVTETVAAEARIAELNATLEQRVAQRTAELEATLGQLNLAQDELARAETRAALNTLIASVSHELSTPLGNSLITANTLVEQARGFGELLQNNQLKKSDLQRFVGEVGDGNDLMQRNLQRAAELLKNFRQVANDQASELRREFDLAQAVREVMQTLAPSLKRQAHRVVVDIPEGIAMNSFPGGLGQLLINLINNAMLHAFDGIERGTVTISASLQGAHVELVCSDNGIGLGAEQQAHMFEPFYTTKRGKGGTGLGMGIVQNLVTKTLGGSITVQSAPGQGTRFAMQLPLTAPRQ